MKQNRGDSDKQYELSQLRETDLDPDPIRQFQNWFEDAVKAGSLYPNAMTLSTADKNGRPSARMMLLKSADENGFVFYTNSESNKGDDLAQNPRAAMVFWWDKVERQVRIEGKIEQVSEQEADSYFRTRPRGSQIGAWVSEQSRVIRSREILDCRMEELEEEYGNREIPRPPYWLGYRLIPVSIEFWQGRANRLHDRLRYRLIDGGKWIIERLAP